MPVMGHPGVIQLPVDSCEDTEIKETFLRRLNLLPYQNEQLHISLSM